MATSERTIRYDPGIYEVLFLPIGEKVFSELNGGKVRCILTMDCDADFERAENVIAMMRKILALQQAP